MSIPAVARGVPSQHIYEFVDSAVPSGKSIFHANTLESDTIALGPERSAQLFVATYGLLRDEREKYNQVSEENKRLIVKNRELDDLPKKAMRMLPAIGVSICLTAAVGWLVNQTIHDLTHPKS